MPSLSTTFPEATKQFLIYFCLQTCYTSIVLIYYLFLMFPILLLSAHMNKLIPSNILLSFNTINFKISSILTQLYIIYQQIKTKSLPPVIFETYFPKDTYVLPKENRVWIISFWRSSNSCYRWKRLNWRLDHCMRCSFH